MSTAIYTGWSHGLSTYSQYNYIIEITSFNILHSFSAKNKITLSLVNKVPTIICISIQLDTTQKTKP